VNYIGSKKTILNFIEESIFDFIETKDNMIFCDIFAGTGIVGNRFKELSFNVIANDIQYYSYILNKHFIANNKNIKFRRLKNDEGITNVFAYLNSLNDYKGFIYNNYTLHGTRNNEFQRNYFTEENAIKIDSIRKKIEFWYENKKIMKKEYYYLLSCLIEASDKVANTASVYEAFLKERKTSALKGIEMIPLSVLINSKTKNKVYNIDCNKLIYKISGDILYMDPPYNARKYNTNYHILETIAMGDSPVIKGKTGIRYDEKKTSKYNKKNEASQALEDIIKNAKFKYIFLSYNNEGIIDIRDIEKIMKKYGKYKRYEKNHRRYKADNTREYLTDSTIEYLHCLEKK